MSWGVCGGGEGVSTGEVLGMGCVPRGRPSPSGPLQSQSNAPVEAAAIGALPHVVLGRLLLRRHGGGGRRRGGGALGRACAMVMSKRWLFVRHRSVLSAVGSRGETPPTRLCIPRLHRRPRTTAPELRENRSRRERRKEPLRTRESAGATHKGRHILPSSSRGSEQQAKTCNSSPRGVPAAAAGFSPRLAETQSRARREEGNSQEFVVLLFVVGGVFGLAEHSRAQAIGRLRGR